MSVGVASGREVDVVVTVLTDSPVTERTEEVLAQHEIIVDTQVARPRCHLTTALEITALAGEVILELKAGVVGGEELVGACHAARVGELLGDAQVAQYHIFQSEGGVHVEAVGYVLDTHGGIIQGIGDDGALPAHRIVIEHFLLLSIGILRDIIGVKARILGE